MRKFEDLRIRSENVLPRLQRLQTALDASKQKLREANMLQLRNVEDNIADWTDMAIRLGRLKIEVKSFSPASLVVAALVVTKALQMTTKLIDVALGELLKRQSRSASFLLGVSSVSGWITLYTFRNTIMEHVDASTQVREYRSRGAASPRNGVVESNAEWLTQLIRNMKRLPNVFWISQAATWLLGLQLSQRIGVRLIKISSRSFVGAFLFQLVGLLVVALSYRACGLSDVERQNLQQKTQRLLSNLRRRRTMDSHEDALEAANIAENKGDSSTTVDAIPNGSRKRRIISEEEAMERENGTSNGLGFCTPGSIGGSSAAAAVRPSTETIFHLAN